MARFAGNGGPSDLDRCAELPVRTIGHIQPHGLLFAVSEPELTVRHVSANVAALLGKPAEEVLGGSLKAVLGARQYEALRAQILNDEHLRASPLRMTMGPNALDMQLVAHRQDGLLIAELELLRGAYSLEPLKLDAHVRMPLTRLESACDIPDLARLAASEIRRLSCFDRVLVYRFDEGWNGEVIAEATGPLPVCYLGLRFPASDIPAQVRRLFLMNPLRTIANAGAEAVPIVSEMGQETGRALDLTHSFLRAAAPVHLEYLSNMGVQASMTISIIVERQLWGLITCHHAAPRRMDWSARSVCELVGQIAASQVALRLDNAALTSGLKSRKLLQEYMSDIETSKSIMDGAHFQGDRLMALLQADGLISRIDGAVRRHGATVEEESLAPAIAKLRSIASRGIASSSMLSALEPGAAAYADQASGALYMGLAEESGDYLLLLRRELVETVAWAGNPDERVRADEQGGLHPRNSFAAWQETVRGRSRPWSALELESACFLREQLLRLREGLRLHKSEARVRYLAHHDTLTGLLNRHSIHLKLEQCVKDAAANESPFAVLFIDLDRFKHHNDTLGHAVGDKILTITAKRMQHQVRGEDVVGRLGGDEFIILLRGLRGDGDIEQAVGRILTAIEEPLGIDQEKTVKITASMGLSRYPADGRSGEELVSRADLAMYRAKRGGGNACVAFQAEDEGAEATRGGRTVP